MNDKELEITLNDDNTISFSDYINTRIAYETVCQEKDKEIERLNNIINEFMEELKWQRKVCLSLNEAFAVSRIDTLISKLQELKGSESNDN